MPAPTRRHVLLLLLVSGLTFFTRLGAASLWDRDEPRNAGCAREMLARGDWVVPVFNGQLRTHKPVLLYWLMMPAYKVFDDPEFAARFWSAALGMGTVLITYVIGRRLFDATAALWAGIVLSTTMQFTLVARAATPEALFVFCLTAAKLVYMLTAFEPKVAPHSDELLPTNPRGRPIGTGTFFPSWPFAALMYAFVGLAVLAKGPAGLVLPVATVGMFLLIVRRPTGSGVKGVIAPGHFLRTAWSMRPVTALLVAAAVALPWYAMVWQRTDGAWVKGFILEHNIGRATRPMEGHGGGLLLYPLMVLFFYPVSILILFFPWSVLIVPTLMDLVKRLRARPRDPWHAGYVFAACWAGVYVGIFSIARTKLPSYLAPMYPALALLTGAFVSQWIRRRAVVPAKAIHDGLALLAVTGAGMVVALPLVAWWFLRGELWTGVVGVVLLAGGLAARRLARQDRAFDAARVFGATAVAGVVLVFGGLVARLDRYQHSRAILAAVRSRSDKPYLATYAKLEPSWVFYSGQTLTEFKDPRPAAELLKTNPNAFVITSDDKFRELKPALPDGTGVVATVPYFGGKGTLLVVGRTGSSEAADEAANASSTASPVRSATE